MWIEVTVGLIGSVVGAIASSLTIWQNLRRPMDALKDKVERLEDEKFGRLEKRFDLHIEADKSQMILTALEALKGATEKLTNKIDKLAEDMARQEAKTEANESYIRNLDKSLQRHKAGANEHGH